MKLRTLGVTCAIVAMASQPVQAGDAFKTYGDVASFAIPAVAGVISYAKGDEDGLIQLGLGAVLSSAAAYGLKKAVHRERPDGSGNDSFPSGHATRAFAGATYLHLRYGLEYGIPAYVAAAAVAGSRVEAKAHHWTDVIAGAALAGVTAYFLTSRYEAPLEVSFMVGEDENRTYGVAARLQF